MPVIVLEALACGRPVIGTRVGGTVDLVKDGRNGLIAEPNNAGALAGALERLVNNPAASEQMGRQAKLDAAAYDLPVVASQYLDLFESLAHDNMAASKC
jgi:glycosyltransferase involved in cell wall biosynthesis